MEIKGFTYESARKFFNPAGPNPKEDLCPDMRNCFVFSMMTNLKDLEEQDVYQRLSYVEFLEMICRVSMSYWDKRREKEMPREDRDKTAYPYSIEEMVDEVLQAVWNAKEKVSKGVKNWA